MKKLLLTALILTALPLTAHAVTTPATATTPTATAADFQAEKAKAVKHAGEKAAEWQQKQTCVQAATTEAALKACMPAHGGRKAKTAAK